MARSDQELLELLADLESDQVERKSQLKNKPEIFQAVCAFSNDLPGYGTSGVAFVGADDDGAPSGLPVTDDLLLELADMRDSGKVLPLPQMRVARLAVGEQHVAVIEVEPSHSPPVRFDGRVCIRMGPRRAIATLDEERRLSERRRSQDLTYDARPLPGAGPEELDLRQFELDYLPSLLPADVIEQNGRTVVEQLSALRLATVDGEPTAAGVLLLGIDPTRLVPGAYVQFLRVDGTSLADPIVDDKPLTGSLPTVLRQMDELLDLNIHTAVDIGATGTDSRHSDYPIAALQQIVRNAVLHRNYEGTSSPVRITWYSDRVEVFSPGGPYGTVSEANFGTPGVTDYRNPVLAEAMAGLGYVQRFGAGLQIVARTLSRGQNPPAEYDPQPTHVGITIRRAVR